MRCGNLLGIESAGEHSFTSKCGQGFIENVLQAYAKFPFLGADIIIAEITSLKMDATRMCRRIVS